MSSIKHIIGAAAVVILLGTPSLAVAQSETVALAPSGRSAAPPIQESREPTACVVRDIKAITQMEAYGQTEEYPAAKMYENFLTMQDARTACSQGRVAESLAIYDSMFSSTTVGTAGQPTTDHFGLR